MPIKLKKIKEVKKIIPEDQKFDFCLTLVNRGENLTIKNFSI